MLGTVKAYFCIIQFHKNYSRILMDTFLAFANSLIITVIIENDNIFLGFSISLVCPSKFKDNFYSVQDLRSFFQLLSLNVQ